MKASLVPPGGAIQDPLLRRLHAYWLERAGGRTMPARADLDPVEMRFILGHLLLVEVLRDPLDFRIRLHGTELARRVGYELTGKMLDKLPVEDFRKLARHGFTATVENRHPLHLLSERAIGNRVFGYEALTLPLSGDGETVDMLLVGLRYADGA
jgi:hypothetical protein